MPLKTAYILWSISNTKIGKKIDKNRDYALLSNWNMFVFLCLYLFQPFQFWNKTINSQQNIFVGIPSQACKNNIRTKNSFSRYFYLLLTRYHGCLPVLVSTRRARCQWQQTSLNHFGHFERINLTHINLFVVKQFTGEGNIWNMQDILVPIL